MTAQKIDFNKIKKIHFIGAGGIGISAIAKLMLVRGKAVSGSDLSDSDILENLRKMGGKIFIGQRNENVASDVDLVVYTPAVAEDNPEMVAANSLKIPLVSYPEALGILLNDKLGITICGTHGKSTTTSMIGLVLEAGGLDPSVVVGSKVPEFGGNLKIGKSNYFVAEACEYKRDFLEYFPKIIVLNNIELDHTDYYKDLEDYRGAFAEFIDHLPEDGVLVVNGDDQNNLRLITDNLKFKKIKIIRFGFDKSNDVVGYDVEIIAGRTKFKVNFRGKDLGSPHEIPQSGNFAGGEIISQGRELGEFELKLPGKFNVYNALAAVAVGLHLDIDAEKIKKALAGFGGIWRRFEIKGEYKGATIVSDYAHHPTAVRETLEAAKKFFPGRRIFAAFQPHQHNRTKMLYQDFLKSFDSADELVLVEIFDVAGREEKKDQDVSSRKLAEDIKKRNSKLAPNIFYAGNISEAQKVIEEKIQKDDIVLVMGAGNIYKVADELVK